MRSLVQGQGKLNIDPNSRQSGLLSVSRGGGWNTEDFIEAHKLVRQSGKFNFEGCKLPVPTAIRYDRLEEALGENASPRELRMLSLVKYGMPIGCKPSYGVKKVQKNHFSAISFQREVSEYFEKGVQAQELLGPFEQPPF